MTDAALAELAQASARRPGATGRSLSIRHVDAGSCNGCATRTPRAEQCVLADLSGLGLRSSLSPRHADVLAVTGPVTVNSSSAAHLRTEAMPDPKWVVAIGGCAIDGGLFKASDAVAASARGDVLPVDLHHSRLPADAAAVAGRAAGLVEA